MVHGHLQRALGYTVPGVVTGKPLALGGSAGRRQATGEGVALIALLADPAAASAVVEGYGKVGRYTAHGLHRRGVRIVGVSDIGGSAIDENGLDLEALDRHVTRAGTVAGFAGSGDLWSAQADLAVPAAMEGSIDRAVAQGLRSRTLVEGANGPTTFEAEEVLAARGVTVVPDILANAGGVVVSYLEWVQDAQHLFWDEQVVLSHMESIMTRAWETVRSAPGSLREAAYRIAVSRVWEAHRLRGLYP